VKRDPVIHGATYKIKPAVVEHALYVTINDVEKDGVRVPFEIFINTKNLEQYEWIVALSVFISAIWQGMGRVDYVIDELKSIHSPQGGYVRKGTDQRMHSVVCEIGHVIEQHVKGLSI